MVRKKRSVRRRKPTAVTLQPKKVTDCIILVTIVAFISLIVIITSYFSYTRSQELGLANPSAVYCEDQGYTYDIRIEAEGAAGYCLFPDGSECPGWDYFRGDCEPITELIQSDYPSVISVSDLMQNPVYNTEVSVYGEVRLLGELFCPCFSLTSDGSGLDCWYDLMSESNTSAWPAVSVEELANHNWVIATGELRTSSGTEPSTTFWLKSIQVIRSS